MLYKLKVYFFNSKIIIYIFGFLLNYKILINLQKEVQLQFNLKVRLCSVLAK